MMAGVLLGPIAAWAALGFPSDRMAIGYLTYAEISALVTAGFFGTKELAGGLRPAIPADPIAAAKLAGLQQQKQTLQSQLDGIDQEITALGG